ncbi:MAG: hypothetical protein CBE43_00125 [Rhodopirellula sp. TMED283]|nr:MAG: hypothetical protein CBE43_00125 [Rhodopirellula sp. TMED283]
MDLSQLITAEIKLQVEVFHAVGSCERGRNLQWLARKHRPDVPGLPDTISIRSALFQQPTFKKLLDSRMCIDNVATVIVTR